MDKPRRRVFGVSFVLQKILQPGTYFYAGRAPGYVLPHESKLLPEKNYELEVVQFVFDDRAGEGETAEEISLLPEFIKMLKGCK